MLEMAMRAPALLISSLVKMRNGSLTASVFLFHAVKFVVTTIYQEWYGEATCCEAVWRKNQFSSGLSLE